MRRSLTIVALVACLAVDRNARAADGTCGPTKLCDVPSAVCETGSCRLWSAPVLFPTDASLAPITLREPAERALLSTSTPGFRWDYPLGTDLIEIAILVNPPRFAQTGPAVIENQEDVVWVWRSDTDGNGPGTSSADYSSGHHYERHDAGCAESPARDLEPGVYYWAAWGWSSANSALKARSEVRTIIVGGERITGTFCSSDADCTGIAGGKCVVDSHYCVLSCASDRDCFTGQTCEFSLLSAKAPWGYCHTPGQCPCPTQSDCDDASDICYRSIEVANSNGCDCDCATNPTRSSPYNCAPAAGITMLAFRRRRTRPSKK